MAMDLEYACIKQESPRKGQRGIRLILLGDTIGLAISNGLSISVSVSRPFGASSVVCTAVKVDEKDEVKGEQSASV